MKKGKLISLFVCCVIGMLVNVNYAATIALSSTDTTYKYDSWEDKSYIDTDVHTASNVLQQILPI